MDHNERYSHQPNLSINSIGSIVEPLTPPPDMGMGESHPASVTGSKNHSRSCSSSSSMGYFNRHYNTQYGMSDHNQHHHGSVSPIDFEAPSTATQSSTPSSSTSAGLGGNTFRSRFKSLPLVSELDQKFNQLNIASLQNLSQQQQQQQVFNVYYNNSGSIPQIPLNNHFQYQQHSARAHDKQSPVYLGKSNNSNQQHHQRFSLPDMNTQRSADNTMVESGPNTATSSPNYKNYDELNQIPIEKLDILKLSVDQYGCRYLQKKLEVDNSIKDIIFNKIFNNVLDLVVDPFGNYLIQKMTDYLTPYQKDMMIEKIHPYLFLISVNQYGTRSLQKIIEGISNAYQMDLVVKGLQMNDTAESGQDNNIVKLIKDLNGNHVIQKCIFKFPPEKFQFITDSICLNNNIVRVSTHKHGCCVLQKLLNNASFDQIIKLSQVLLIYLDDLINDQFGNYIIQFLFELDFLKTASETDFLINDLFTKIYQNLVQLSCLKFSSNVIEKFIKIMKIKRSYVFLNEIIKVINVNFEILIKDKFGNYVIQTLIDQFYDVTELNLEMSALVNTAKNYLPAIKAAPYARKIQLKIQQLESNNLTSTLPRNASIPKIMPAQYDQMQLQPQYINALQFAGGYNGYDGTGNFNNRYFANHPPQFYTNIPVKKNSKNSIPPHNGEFTTY